jgi:hypothetical protein
MADTSFIEKLRMNNIFPPGGGGQGPFTAPDLSAGQMDPQKMRSMMDVILPSILSEKQKDRDLQIQLAQMQHQPSGLKDIGTHIAKEKPMTYSYGGMLDSMTPYQKASIQLEKDKLKQSGVLGQQKLSQSGQDVQTRIRRADIAQKIADGRATDEEKNEYILGQIEERGNQSRQSQTIRGEQAMEQIGARGNEARETTGMRGENQLANIAARIKGQQDVNAAKPTRPMLPTQSKVMEANAARELINTRPELAPFVKQNQDGTYSITPPGTGGWFSDAGPSEQQYEEIKSSLYPGNVPTKPAKSTTVAPTIKSTTVAPSKSKYKVMIE